MPEITIKLEQSKETKNNKVFSEIETEGQPIALGGGLYIKNEALKDLGDPKSLTVIVEAP